MTLGNQETAAQDIQPRVYKLRSSDGLPANISISPATERLNNLRKAIEAKNSSEELVNKAFAEAGHVGNYAGFLQRELQGQTPQHASEKLKLELQRKEKILQLLVQNPKKDNQTLQKELQETPDEGYSPNGEPRLRDIIIELSVLHALNLNNPASQDFIELQKSAVELRTSIQHQIRQKAAAPHAAAALKAIEGHPAETRLQTIAQGSSTTTETQRTPSDTEIEQRALAIEPLDLKEIKEHPEIPRRSYDPRVIKHVQNGNVIEVKFESKDWYTIPGKVHEISINGERRKFIFSSSTGTGALAFDPSTNTYTISPDAVDRFRKDPQMFISGFLHEAGHDKYFSLSEARQKQFNDLILNNPQLRDALLRFGTTLYTDKQASAGSTAGENYLKVHAIDNDATRQNGLAPDGQKGLKDTRGLVFKINGQQREVFAGPLITEFVSYMSALQVNRHLFDREAEAGKARRGGEDPRYDAIFLGFVRIQRDPQLKWALESYGIFKDNTPQLTPEITNLLNSALSL